MPVEPGQINYFCCFKYFYLIIKFKYRFNLIITTENKIIVEYKNLQTETRRG